MESSIKIDFRDNGNGIEPVISVRLIDSDDTRDRLLKTFFQSLMGSSSWLSVSFDHHIIDDTKSAKTFISISTVKGNQLNELAAAVNGRINLLSTSTGSQPTNSNPIQDRYQPPSQNDPSASEWSTYDTREVYRYSDIAPKLSGTK